MIETKSQFYLQIRRDPALNSTDSPEKNIMEQNFIPILLLRAFAP